ncbi:hypothetical protein V8E54_005434 [Elaphomyces granulatus]
MLILSRALQKSHGPSELSTATSLQIIGLSVFDYPKLPTQDVAIWFNSFNDARHVTSGIGIRKLATNSDNALLLQWIVHDNIASRATFRWILDKVIVLPDATRFACDTYPDSEVHIHITTAVATKNISKTWGCLCPPRDDQLSRYPIPYSKEAKSEEAALRRELTNLNNCSASQTDADVVRSAMIHCPCGHNMEGQCTKRLAEYFEGSWVTDWVLKKLIDQRMAIPTDGGITPHRF